MVVWNQYPPRSQNNQGPRSHANQNRFEDQPSCQFNQEQGEENPQSDTFLGTYFNSMSHSQDAQNASGNRGFLQQKGTRNWQHGNTRGRQSSFSQKPRVYNPRFNSAQGEIGNQRSLSNQCLIESQHTTHTDSLEQT